MAEQGNLGLPEPKKNTGPVECLGQTFESDEARREHYLALLAEKLKDPEFRKMPGFPKGTDEAILRMSDPPYYTACPNPFLEEFVRVNGRPYDPDEKYDREPFAVDVSVGKTDQLYRAHGYHTKVPHLAIVPSILHYTKPGDLVLDGFCGSGMTGVAAQWCGTAPTDYRRKLEGEWRQSGHAAPEWGARNVVLNDLGPAATFIASNLNIPFDVDDFSRATDQLLDFVENEVGWMYETLHTDGKTKGRIEYTVWSDVFSCPDCLGEVVFLQEAMDQETKRMADKFPCPHCTAELTKKKLGRLFETRFDSAISETIQAPKRKPVLINYSIGKAKFEKPLDIHDMALLGRVANLSWPVGIPTTQLPYMHMTHERARMDRAGVTHIHHFFLPRAAHALSCLWRKAVSREETRSRNMLLFFAEQAIWGISVLNRYKPIQFGRPGGSQVNNYMSGIYYVVPDRKIQFYQ
jgi:hypothetical protein